VTGIDSPASVKMRVIPHLRPTRPIGIDSFLCIRTDYVGRRFSQPGTARWHPV
jgi:hypothetical protein